MNVPSYNALFTSRDRTVKTIMQLCEEINKSGGGDSSGIFIYELDLSGNNMTPGTYPIEDTDLPLAIHNAFKAGKQVYISASNYPGAYVILPLTSVESTSEMGGYSFMTTSLGGDPPKYYTVTNMMIGVLYSEQQSQSFLTISITKPIETVVVNHGTSRTTYTLPANECHIWGTVPSLNINLATPENSSIVNEYWFIFTSGSTPTNLTLPEGLLWDTNIDTTSQFIEANTTYEFHICNNIVRMGGAR